MKALVNKPTNPGTTAHNRMVAYSAAEKALTGHGSTHVLGLLAGSIGLTNAGAGHCLLRLSAELELYTAQGTECLLPSGAVKILLLSGYKGTFGASRLGGNSKGTVDSSTPLKEAKVLCARRPKNKARIQSLFSMPAALMSQEYGWNGTTSATLDFPQNSPIAAYFQHNTKICTCVENEAEKG